MSSNIATYHRRNSKSPAIASRKLTFSDEDNEQDGGVGGEKMQTLAVENDGDEDYDDEDLDRFEDDGFIVYDNVEEEEGDEEDSNEEQRRRRKRKKRSYKNIVLEDDDLELIQENAALGIVPFKDRSQGFKRLKQAEKGSEVVEFTGYYDDSIFDDVYGEEEALNDNEEDDMGDFIVDDEIDVKRAPSRYWNPDENESKQALVVYTSPSKAALREAGFIIGDVDEILNQQKQALAMVVEPDESNEFEPLFLMDKYMTERDDYAREVDLPERMQMFEEIAGPPPIDAMSIEEESDWILIQLAKIVIDEGCGSLSKIKKEDITRFLELHHVEKYDIPFIFMYRKEQCLSLLDDIELDEEQGGADEQSCRLKWHKILWTVKELDKKWLLLHKRKIAMQAYYEKRYDAIIDEGCKRISDDLELSLYKQHPFESIKESLMKAESGAEIDDVEKKFSLLYPLDDGMVDGNFKRPNQKSHYANCRNAGLWKLASQFGYNSEQLGLLISLEKVEMEFPEDPDEAPEEMALNFIHPVFENPEAVLKGARHMAAVEISCEPCIRKYVRCVFMDKAVVSTSPTSKGNKVVDSLHQFAAVKWLRDKPLNKFKDAAQWLLIQKAEEEKLLKVTIRLLENDLNNLLDVFNRFYLRDGVGLWNEQRKLVLQDSVSNFLLPPMEKEARVALTTRAKKWLLSEYSKQLWKKVSVAPYAHKEIVPPRVMACCWGPGNPATTFVMLDSSGELLEVLEARSLHLRSQDVNTQQRKQNDQLRLLKFIGNHQPNVIVVGAANVSCVELKDKIKEIVSKIEESRGTEQYVDKINVVYGDEMLPQLYESSQISEVQLRRQPGIVKRAVALGRYIQSPLAMVANLCGTEKEIVSWKLSSMDDYLSPDEKFEMIEQVMVDITNQVGVDINLALKHVWYLPLLQFVSGLGPQKAVFLRQKMVEGRAISSRKGLTSFGLSTKLVFHNSVGFLCVRHNGFLRPCAAIEPLDGTRIHPESYVLAENLARAVCNDDMLDDPIRSLKKNPGLLREFNINDYAERYEIQQGENMKETLSHIKMELLHGFLDPRTPYKEPTPDEEFKMITGKYGEIFAEGRTLEAKVQQVQSQRAFFTLDSGLTGILAKEDFSDEGGDSGLHDKLRGVHTLSCKIKDIDRSSYQVHLTCKDSDMKKTSNNISDADPYYCESENISASQEETVCKGKEFTKKNFMPRSIKHPKFKNMNSDQAVEFLSDKDIGDCVFRPSSRGPSHLTLTLKVFDDLYAHNDIIEGGKNMKSFTGLLQLGTSLTIGRDTFNDLNEVMDQYVSPVVKHIEEILSSRKFKKGSQAEVDEVLKSAEPDDHALGLSYEHPGTFILTHIKDGNLQHEYVGLLPSGFMFRKRVFKNIEDLLASFQNGDHNVQPNSTPEKNPSPRKNQMNFSQGIAITRDTNDDDSCKKSGNEIEWVSVDSVPKNEVKDPLAGGWSKGSDDDNGCSGRGGAKTGNSILGAFPGTGRGRGCGFGDDNQNKEAGWGGGQRNEVGGGGWGDQNNGSKNESSCGGGWDASGGNQGGQQKPAWEQKHESFHSGGAEKRENWGSGGNAGAGCGGNQEKPSWGQKQESFHCGGAEKKENWGSGGNGNAGGGWGGSDDTRGGNEGSWRGGGRGDRGRGSNYSRGRGQRNDFDNDNNENSCGGWGSGWGGNNNKENEGGGWRGGNNSRGGGSRGDGGRGRGRGSRNGDDSEGGNFGGGWNSSHNDKNGGSWGGNGGNWQSSGNSQNDYGSPNRGRGRGGGRGRGNFQNNEDGGRGRGGSRGRGGRGNWDNDGNSGGSGGRGSGNWGGNGNSGENDWNSSGNGGFGGGGGRRGRGGRGNSGGGYNDGADGGGRRGRGGRGGWSGGGNSGRDDWNSSRGGNGGSGGCGRRGRGGRGNWGGNGNDGAECGGRRGRGGRGNWGSNENYGGNNWSSGGGGGNWSGGGGW